MKKFLVLFLVVALLLVTGCSQKEESYVAYLSYEAIDDGFSGHHLIDYAPLFRPMAFYDQYYDDPSADPVKSIELNGQVIEGEYRNSEMRVISNSKTIKIHRYDYWNPESNRGHVDFNISDSGQLRFFSMNPLSTSDQSIREEEAIEIAKKQIYDWTGVNVDSYTTEIDYDGKEYTIEFKKFVNGVSTSDGVRIFICNDGFCSGLVTFEEFGTIPDGLDVTFDQELVDQAVNDRITYAMREIEKEYGKYHIEPKKFKPFLHISPDGKPYLSISVPIKFPESEFLGSSTIITLNVFMEEPSKAVLYVPETD